MGPKVLGFFFPNMWGFSYSRTDSNQKLFPNYFKVNVNTYW